MFAVPVKESGCNCRLRKAEMSKVNGEEAGKGNAEEMRRQEQGNGQRNGQGKW